MTSATRPDSMSRAPTIASERPDNRLLLTVDEACQLLRIGRWMLYRLIQTRRLETVKIGRRRLIPADALRAFLDRARAEEAP